MTANGNDAKAQFELVADGKGTIVLDVVSLFPPTFKNRENGLRPDLAQLLYNIHPKFVRFPGGCYVEGQESPENAFHWEKTIGPIEERPGHKNVNWRYRTSDGMGFDEYLQLAEDLNAKPLYVVNVGLWHGGMTPVDSIQPWIDECMNALEYANGPVTSKYGALRAKNVIRNHTISSIWKLVMRTTSRILRLRATITTSASRSSRMRFWQNILRCTSSVTWWLGAMTILSGKATKA